ncbi:MAG TPA: hypothetical protein VGC09_15965 [Rhodopila sp.]
MVHVGPHKTGTTYLQLRFDAARERLRQGGVVYPAEWSSAENEPSHRKLVVGLREGRTADLKSQFEAIERGNPEYVLISGEGINHLPQSAIAALRTLMGSHPVTLIFYCRRWSELLPSLWQERVKHGYDETFPEFFADNMSDPFASVIMNFALRLNVYADVFGFENIRLVSYSNICDAGIDLADHFFDTFLPHHRSLIDDLSVLPVARPNQSLPPLQVEVMRALNAFSIRNGTLPPSSALREWSMAHAGRFETTALLAAIRAAGATLHFSDASSSARQLQDALSATYLALMVPPVKPGRLFEPGASEIPFFHQRYLTDRSAWRILDELYTAYRATLRSAV